jgi:ankyrin repeat protein
MAVTTAPRVTAFRDDLEYYDGRAWGLLASAQDGTEGAVATFERWGAPLTEAGVRTVLAREHGFSSWSELGRHVESLGGSKEPFIRAYRAVEAQDVAGLRRQLDRAPELVHTPGTNHNDLLGMAAATCDERLVAVLLEYGADPTRANVHGWTPLHQAAYSDLPHLARMLLAASAPVDVSARGEGGTPLVVALFWGNRQTAELLAEHGVLPANLRAAAGLGLTGLIEELVSSDGALSPPAGARRAYYRPHSGFPSWRPSDEPQEILDEALSWAARNDRIDALELLVSRGARVDADVYRGTALAWASSCGHVTAVRRLLDLGADPNARTTFGGPDHGEAATALHLAAEGNRLDVIRVLLEAGADPTIRDVRHDHTPAGWAKYGGHEAARDLLLDPWPGSPPVP